MSAKSAGIVGQIVRTPTGVCCRVLSTVILSTEIAAKILRAMADIKVRERCCQSAKNKFSCIQNISTKDNYFESIQVLYPNRYINKQGDVT